MKLLSFALAAMLAAPALAAAPTGTSIVTPGTIHWVAETSALKGTYMATLSGDPSKAGLYVIRLKLPPGTVYAPHFHDDVECVTVISGALWVGLGDTMTPSRMTELGPGSFMTVAAKVHHYALIKTPTIIQVEGLGPQTMTMVHRTKP
ncbi:MAG TPA: cupin domain-containing protein [Candidatus Baltobacteraceae bacterium]|jgi:hypothetical protein|nr:cupin domain-containing protein [Candidatus Baltobacteraceae bacterium]